MHHIDKMNIYKDVEWSPLRAQRRYFGESNGPTVRNLDTVQGGGVIVGISYAHSGLANRTPAVLSLCAAIAENCVCVIADHQNGALRGLLSSATSRVCFGYIYIKLRGSHLLASLVPVDAPKAGVEETHFQ